MTAKTHRKSRLHGAVARYRDARRSLHTPASPQSRYGLDWMNFFVADVQTGFGTFVAFYLAYNDWSVRDVGFILTIGSLASVLSQNTGRRARGRGAVETPARAMPGPEIGRRKSEAFSICARTAALFFSPRP